MGGSSPMFPLDFSPLGYWGGGGELYCLQTSSLKHKLAREAKSSFIYDGVDVGGNSQAS